MILEKTAHGFKCNAYLDQDQSFVSSSYFHCRLPIPVGKEACVTGGNFQFQNMNHTRKCGDRKVFL